MLRMRAYVPPERAEAMRTRLASVSGVRHLVLGGQTWGGMAELTGDIDAAAADVVLEMLGDFELGAEDLTLSHTTSVQPLAWRRGKGVAGRDAIVWAEVLGRARK